MEEREYRMARSLCPSSQAQLALALAVVKLKPTSLSIKEYIIEVRSHIVNGKARDVDASRKTPRDSYFNSVKFWQEAYERSEEVKRQLLDKIYDLEQRNETLLFTTKSLKYDNGVGMERNAVLGTPESGKVSQKRINGDNIDTTRPKPNNNKRTRQVVNSQVNGNLDADTVPATGTVKRRRIQSPCRMNYEDGGKDILARQTFALRSAMSKRQNYSGLVLATVELCKAIEKALRSASDCVTTEASKASNSFGTFHPSLQATYFTAQNACQLSYQSLHKMATSTYGARYQGQIIYQLVSLFESILRILESQCRSLSAQPPLIDQGRTRGRPKKKQEKAQSFVGKLTRSTDITELSSVDNLSQSVLWHTTCLLQTMISELHMANSHHVSIMEGYLFVLINRVGRVLSSLRLESSQSPGPTNKGAVEESKTAALPGSLDGAALVALELETAYLAPTLEKAMKTFKEATTLSREPFTGNGASLHPLQRLAKNKLQNTLLKAIFGEAGEEFGSSLTKPRSPEIGLPKNPRPADSPGEWFTQEVWRLIGWDILEDVLKSKFTGTTTSGESYPAFILS